MVIESSSSMTDARIQYLDLSLDFCYSLVGASGPCFLLISLVEKDIKQVETKMVVLYISSISYKTILQITAHNTFSKQEEIIAVPFSVKGLQESQHISIPRTTAEWLRLISKGTCV